jgi:hypothetical protein
MSVTLVTCCVGTVRPHVDLLRLIVEIGAPVDLLKFGKHELGFSEGWPIAFTRLSQVFSEHDLLCPPRHRVLSVCQDNRISYKVADFSERLAILPVVGDERILNVLVT